MQRQRSSINSQVLPWYEMVFNSLDFSGVLKNAGIDIKGEPDWVQNVLRKLVQQVMPAFQIRKVDRVTPRNVGLLIGQQCANWHAIGGRLEGELAAAKIAQTEVLINLLITSQAFYKAAKEPFNKIALDAFRLAWEQPNHSEMVAFFEGFAESLSKPGIVNYSPTSATTATPIYNRLFGYRREVERLGTIRELREFLLQHGLTKQVLGNQKRLEKLCHGIKLAFAKRGRPRKAK